MREQHSSGNLSLGLCVASAEHRAVLRNETFGSSRGGDEPLPFRVGLGLRASLPPPVSLSPPLLRPSALAAQQNTAAVQRASATGERQARDEN